MSGNSNLQPKKITDILFPPTLKNKKNKRIRIESISSDVSVKDTKFNEKFINYITNYLESKNPLYFVKIIRNRPELLHDYLAGKKSSLGLDLFMEVNDLLDKKGHKKKQHHIYEKNLIHGSRQYVDIETIVRETLNWWREIQNFTGNYQESKLARKYLEKLAPLETFKRNETVITEGGEFLIHTDDLNTHSLHCVTYISPTEFIAWWEKVYSIFEKFKSKKHYKSQDTALKKSDALKAIRYMGNELSDYEVNKLDLTNTRTKTSSYIKLYHQDRCPLCKKRGLSNSIIIRRLYDARKELKKIQ